MSTEDSLFSVAGKRALVTGGSRGIGRAIAEALVRAGAEVIITSRKRQDLDETAASLAEFGSCKAIAADLASPDGVSDLVAAVERRWDRLDLLVNNAGATWGAPLQDFPVAGWDKVFDTNVRGVFLLTTGLLDLLRAAAKDDDPARVIVIGSVDGLRVPELSWDNYPYSASKAAAHMLTRHLAARLAPEHITVNAIAPGFFESRMTSFLLDDGGREDLAGIVPLGRIGRPEDLAGVTLFLASRAGAYLTGTVVTVDGGVTLAASSPSDLVRLI